MTRDSILIVEDNPLSGKLAGLLFESEGYEVRMASSAREALAALERFHPDVVLTDLRLPDMDGFELVRLIRADPTLRDLVVVATSAENGVDEERIRRAGCDGFVPKPIEVESVRARAAGLRVREAPPRDRAGRMDAAADERFLQLEVVERIHRATRKLGLEGSDLSLAPFFSRAALDLDQLRQALAEGDRERIRAVAHGLAGLSAMLGAARVAGICRDLEKAAALGVPDQGAILLLARLDRELEAVRAAVRQLEMGVGREAS